mmetsp:Transcript_36977/g.45211  ORF Transcript_36977/g.45211 Transcript_36977/m.45211 type:complete len:94 (-) Transcript_36977:151-432(-)
MHGAHLLAINSQGQIYDVSNYLNAVPLKTPGFHKPRPMARGNTKNSLLHNIPNTAATHNHSILKSPFPSAKSGPMTLLTSLSESSINHVFFMA